MTAIPSDIAGNIAGDTAGSVVTGVIFNIKDQEKLNKLIDLAEKAAATAASRSDEESTGTDSMGGADTSDAGTTGTAAPISTEMHQGVTIKRFSGAEDKETFYATIDNRLLASSDRGEIKALIDRAKGGAAQNLAALSEFKTIEAKLTEPAEVYVYMNQKHALEMQEMPGNMEQFSGLIRQISAGYNVSGLSFKVNANNITMHGFGPFSPGEGTSPMADLLKKNPATKPLEVLGFAPEKTLIAFGTNLVDSKLFYSMIREFYAAITSQPAGELDKTLTQAEAQLGFSVQNDLLPALGNEAAFMLNSIKIGGGLPAVDAALIFRIADKTKMQKVMTAVEAMVAKRMGAASTGEDSTPASGSAQGFKSDTANGLSIKYLEMPNAPTYTPSYAMAGDYLIIATTRDSIQNMNALKGGKAGGLLASAAYKALGEKVTAQANVFQYVDFSGFWDAASGFMTMMPGAQGAAKWIDTLRVIKTAAGAKISKEDGVYSEGVLLLQ